MSLQGVKPAQGGDSVRPDARIADHMHILVCANAAYFQHASVTIASLADSNPDHPISVHIMTCDTDSPEQPKLASIISEYPNLDLNFYNVDAPLVEDLFVCSYFSREVYLRIVAADILPPHVHRILYLDSDIVVLDDILDLWRVDLEGNVLGGVSDVDFLMGLLGDRLEDLGIRPEGPYINSGVLVIDVDAWRDGGIADRILEYARAQGPKLKFVDQDAINGALQGQMKILDLRWNLVAMSYSWTARWRHKDYFRMAQSARHRPAILHFTSSAKPWKFRSQCRKKHLYFKYLDKTAWRNQRPVLETRLQNLEYAASVTLLEYGLDIYRVSSLWRLAYGRCKRTIKEMSHRLGDIVPGVRSRSPARKRPQ